MPVAPVVAAGCVGYRNAERACFADDPAVGWRAGKSAAGVVELRLGALAPRDDPTYRFQTPDAHADPDDVMACATCHMSAYQSWIGSRHARMATHGHVDWHKQHVQRGGKSSAACDACHAPGRVLEDDADHLMASNHCDLCHKIWRVGNVHASGVAGAIEFLRPDVSLRARPGTLHTVFGTRVDVSYAYMGAAYNPLFATSHLCASCHQGGAEPGGAPKINTFEEWRTWAAQVGPQASRSCQDCHMPRGRDRNRDGSHVTQIAWDAMSRSPAALHDHGFHGVTPSLGARALGVRIEKSVVGRALHVRVRVTNKGAGHRAPTGTWTKHIVAGIWAQQGDTWLVQRDGPARHACRGGTVCCRHAAARSRRLAQSGRLRLRRARARCSRFVFRRRLWLGLGPRRTWKTRAWSRWGTGTSTSPLRCPAPHRRRHRPRRQSGSPCSSFTERGVLRGGPAETPWPVGPLDPPPQVLLLERVK